MALPAAGAQVAPGPGVNPGAEPADEPLHGGQLTGLALPVAAAAGGGGGVVHSWLCRESAEEVSLPAFFFYGGQSFDL